jgi:hypothetical protein
VDGFRLSPSVVTAGNSSASATYQFVTDAGAWMSYSDFNVFRLYDPVSQIVVATAALPGNGFTGSATGTTGSATPRPSGTSSTGSTAPSASATSSASGVAAGGLALFGAVMMML